ncbi:MAG: class I SAM-dependent methyltransferase, partial [Actinomycetes bacterium]
LTRDAPFDLGQSVRLLTDGRWNPPDFVRHPRILVAGCGTGRELLGATWRWQPTTVTAFDLSRSSLAYAQRMADDLGMDVEFYQADLLELGDWDREFDVIICTGVLHHLRDPLDGWRQLVRLLRADGLMLIGLYSQAAREGIASGQAELRRMRVAPSPDGIRAARAHLAGLASDHPATACLDLQDFYYVSGCRDMLFHVQEHQFTIPQIAAALDRLGLEFLSFDIDPRVRRLCRTLFGLNPGLTEWETMERLFPRTFLGMYQFWCQKRGYLW